MDQELVTEDYADFIGELKERIRNAQVRAALNVNRELVLLYWQIGREIRARQGTAGWARKSSSAFCTICASPSRR